MTADARSGRPRASSRETIAEAACELFLEQGYEGTSVTDIATRAGVSRSSFFNYFDSKSALLWGGFDERLDVARTALAEGEPVRGVLCAIADRFAPDVLALAIAQADTMGVAEELERGRAVRAAQLGRAIAEREQHGGKPRLAADVAAGAAAGAVMAAVWAWAHAGPGRTALEHWLREALALVPGLGGEVRQLRVVVEADDFERALTFYRDVVGMPQSEAYEAEGGARVAILDAGRATLELSNPAQVAFIDRVETDGDAPSDRIRIGLEVDDAAGAARRLAEGGARLEASARTTPWRSRNARLRGPAGLQLTLFQELGPE